MPNTNSSGHSDEAPQKADKTTTLMPLQARGIGLFLFLLGLGLAWWIRSDIVGGVKVAGELVVLTPIALLLGLGILAEPRLLLAQGRDPRLKVIAFVVLGVGLALGLFVRYAFFK